MKVSVLGKGLTIFFNLYNYFDLYNYNGSPMKKYFSSILVLILFLNSFAVLAMERRVEDFYEPRRGMDTWQEDSSESDNNKFYKGLEEQVPDDVVAYGVSKFLDPRSLNNVRRTNRFFKDRVEESAFFVNQGDLGSASGLFSYNVSPEKVKRLDRKIKRDLRDKKNTRIIFVENGKFREFDKETFKDMVLKTIKDPQFLKGLQFLNRKKMLGSLFCVIFSIIYSVPLGVALFDGGLGVGGAILGVAMVGIGGGILTNSIFEASDFIHGESRFSKFCFDLFGDCYKSRKKKLKKRLVKVLNDD